MTISIKQINLEIIQQNTEDYNKLKVGLSKLIPKTISIDLDKTIVRTKLLGYHKNKISLLLLSLTKKKDNLVILEHIMSLIVPIGKKDFEKRLTDKGELFLRLNKQLLLDDRFVIDNSSDVYKIKIKFLYKGSPSSRFENIINFVLKLNSSE